MLSTKIPTLFAVVLSLLLTVFSMPTYAETSYTVSNGNELDIQSYQGFKVFRKWCARCHGTYGQGMRAPNLAESIAVISKEEYLKVMTSGKRSAKAREIGMMPAWKGNAEVMANLDTIYSYLKARADGKIDAIPPRSANCCKNR
jgi:mono/diheme cytochrome c family protein